MDRDDLLFAKAVEAPLSLLAAGRMASTTDVALRQERCREA
jgi:hypothetical protein